MREVIIYIHFFYLNKKEESYFYFNLILNNFFLTNLKEKNTQVNPHKWGITPHL